MTLIYQKTLPAPPHGRRSWVRPVHLSAQDSAFARSQAPDTLFPLAGGWMAFSHVDVMQKQGTDVIACRMPVSAYLDEASDKQAARDRIEKLTKPRSDLAGLSMAEPRIMGIVNATPDSFSDGGQHFEARAGIDGALAMAKAGAHILDVGGESTRPGAEPVGRDEEIRRIEPIISALVQAGHIVSADTRHTIVMEKAAECGAQIINDVGGFRDEGAPELLAKVAQTKADTGYGIAMHMQGTPETMQQNPVYDFAPLDVYDWLEERIEHLMAAGVPAGHIAVDPGFGFGKTPAHNLEIINWTSLFHGLGVPVLIGVSRKSTIAKCSKGEPATERLGGSLALTLRAIEQGAQIIRTHDVAQTAQAISLYCQTRHAV
ncbi:MAG: dihydropteroate synthase [Candidatus Puniceispirillaceae bacterium]